MIMKASFLNRTSLSALLPFGLFGIGWCLFYAEETRGMFLLLLSILPMFIFFGTGWTKNFPRRSLPALGFCLFFSIYLMRITVPAFSNEPLGWLAWIPLLVTFAICLILNPKTKPVRALVGKIKDDPSLILFILYGFSPMFVFLFYDGIRSNWMIPVILLSTLMLSSGLYIFLESKRKKIRVISIVTSGLLTVLLALAVSMAYSGQMA
jgi:hypothetical protein